MPTRTEYAAAAIHRIMPVTAFSHAEMAGNQVENIFKDGWFCDIGIATMVERAPFGAGHSEGGSRDERNPAGVGIGLELPRGVEPGHVGQPQIPRNGVAQILSV